MSLPDNLLEDDRPEESEYCEEHPDYLRPCRVCRAEARMERAEEGRER